MAFATILEGLSGRPPARAGDGDLLLGMLSSGDCAFSEVGSNLKCAPLSAHMLLEGVSKTGKPDNKRITALFVVGFWRRFWLEDRL